MELPDNPVTRSEQYLAKIATGGGEIPAYPITREERYLNYIAEHGGGGGGGGTAADTTYDNSTSGLEADNVQDAIDELASGKLDSQQDAADVGKVLKVGEDGMVTPQPESAEWGKIGGSLADQDDLTAALGGKVSVAQGMAHAGDFVVVGSDGNITTQAFSVLEGGSY